MLERGFDPPHRQLAANYNNGQEEELILCSHFTMYDSLNSSEE